MMAKRGEAAAIVPSETKPVRASKMTDDEFDAYLARERRKLDDQPPHPNDKFWRRTEIRRKVADGWTVGQLARYFQATREQMRELVKAAKQERRAA